MSKPLTCIPQVYTLGGARGPSVSYFVPYLSAMQLFTPASSKVRIGLQLWPVVMVACAVQLLQMNV